VRGRSGGEVRGRGTGRDGGGVLLSLLVSFGGEGALFSRTGFGVSGLSILPCCVDLGLFLVQASCHFYSRGEVWGGGGGVVCEKFPGKRPLNDWPSGGEGQTGWSSFSSKGKQKDDLNFW